MLIKAQLMARAAHPSGLAGRIAHDQGIGGHFPGDYGAGADEGVGSDFVTAHDGGIGTDGSSSTHYCAGVLVFPGDGTAGIDDIGEYTRGSEEYVVFTHNTGVKTYIILHLHVIAQHNVWTDHDILPDVAVFPNQASGHDVGEMPDSGSSSDGAAVIYDSRGMCLIFSHDSADVFFKVLVLHFI